MRFGNPLAKALVTAVAMLLVVVPARSEKNYGPGASDSEIKIGQTMPYSGPASAYSWIAKAQAAYFRMINDQGGVNGRKLNLISLDDGYNPSKAVEQTRRLIEQEQVLMLYQSLGTASNTAILKYTNQKKVPHVFAAVGAVKFSDPKANPWTMLWQPPFQHEMHIIARYILKNLPNAKVGVLYQNDDFGKDALTGVYEGFGAERSRMIVAEATYEVTDPTVDSQLIALKASGADTLITLATPKATSQAIRKVASLGWKPNYFIAYNSSSVELVLKPAGLENAIGITSTAYLKDPSDPSWKDDKATQEYLAWAAKYLPEGNPSDLFLVYGYSNAHSLVQVLKQCGDDLSRENVMRQATSLKDLEGPMLLPGMKINTSPTDFFPLKYLQLMRFDGKRWVRFGDILAY
jgi:ABC-type branched-subunit amino acid transport system substrate-binding protein